MTLSTGVVMAKLLGVLLLGIVSLSAVEIYEDTSLKNFSLKRGIEVWLKEHFSASAQVACRFIGQDPRQGKPQIFDLDCPAEIFEEELPSFLDYCEEEIQKKGGASIGLVAVGSVDAQELHHYLVDRYDQSEIRNEISEEAIQLIPTYVSSEFDVLLSYPTALKAVQSDDDLKKLWVFYLIQSMAENRFKKAAVDVDGLWVSPEDLKYLLPTQNTVGHGVERIHTTAQTEGRLLKSFLTAIQELKERGFTENELADSKSQLIKHLQRFYEASPNEKTLADYYACHLAASLPCSEYSPFMTLSIHLIPEISMTDVADMLNASFKDAGRRVVIRCPEGRELSKEQVQETLGQFVSDAIEFKYEGPAKVEIVEGKDPFSQLPITLEEQNMIRGVIQTVAETNLIKLGFMKSDLEDERKKLIHIHPLRSLVAMCSDSYTKKCLAEIMDNFFKWGSFISDFSKRMNQEADRDNLAIYIQGFCLSIKANPDKVRIFISNKEWEKLVKYLITL